MKKKWLAALCCLMISAMSVTTSAEVIVIGSSIYSGWYLNEANFPDPEFRAYLSTLDTANIGFLRDAVEIPKIKTLYLDKKDNTSYSWRKGNIKSLKGIEHLTALTGFTADNNQITSIDLSKNTGLKSINLAGNKLTELDVSRNTALTEINCYNNPLPKIDVSKNVNLDHLDCDNDLLTQLDVSQNVKLADLSCWGNKLTKLDVSHNPALTWLDCSVNELVELDVSGCPNLVNLVKNCPRKRNNADRLDYFYDSQNHWQLLIDPWVKVIAGSVTSEPTEQVPENVKASQRNAALSAGSQTTSQTGSQAGPQDTVQINGLNYRLSGKNAIFTGPVSRAASVISLPATIQSGGVTYKVTQIAADACKGLPALKTLTIGKNVKAIGKNAFRNCKKLKKITIKTIKLTGSSVKAGAFKGIYKKVKITCPKKKKASYKKLLMKKGVGKKAIFK